MIQITKINGVPVINTTVSGVTYDNNSNLLTISSTNGVNQSVVIDEMNSLTITDGLTANTISATTLNSSGDINGYSLVSTQSNNDEGGEFRLATPQTNTTLSGSQITVDVYQNKLRFFESGGSNRGVYIDLTAAATGVGTNLLFDNIIINDTVESSPVFGTAFAEVIAKTYTIPANTFGTTDFLKLYLSVEKDLQNGGVVVEVKMSNSPTFIAGTAASSRVLRSITQGVFTATVRYMGISRIFNRFDGSGNLKVSSITLPTDQAGAVTVQTGNNTLSLDPTQTIYVWVTLTNFSALDTSKVTSFLLTN